MRNAPARTALVNNVTWFAVSFGLAFLVWLVATTEANPVRERVFTAIPINLHQDSEMILANADTLRRTVNVTVRAQQSVLEVLTREDITVNANLTNLPAGTHTVRLETTVARPAAADTSPVQITVELVERQARQKTVIPRIVSEPPAGFQRGEPVVSETQILVSGSLAQVDQVDHLEARLDLSDRRDSVDDEIELVAVNSLGEIVTGVEIAQPVRVFVEITPIAGVVEFPVNPIIDYDTLPDGYVARPVDYEPKFVSVSGSSEALARLPDTLITATIDLTNRTESFIASVPVLLATEDAFVLDNQRIAVEIEIKPRMTQRQFDDIPVTLTGLAAGLEARAVPSRVSVQISGPQPALDLLTSANITVIVNLQALTPGTYDVRPVATLTINGINPDEIQVLPSTIGVIVTQAQVTPTPSPTASPQLTPTR